MTAYSFAIFVELLSVFMYNKNILLCFLKLWIQLEMENQDKCFVNFAVFWEFSL